MVGQIYAACGVVTIALMGLMGSSVLSDHGLDGSLSRRLASALGGIAFLVAVVWLNAWPAVALSAILTLLILGLRLGYSKGLRGVKGRLPSQNWAEVTFALAGTVSLAIGWGIFDQKWLAFLPIAFMAWGDNSAGLVRDTICRTRMGSIWPSLAMLGVCLAAAAFFRPFWIGASGAIIATLAERYRPRFLRIWDDNLIVVMASLTLMIILAKIVL